MKRLIPQAITDWVESHKGWRTPMHVEDAFESYSNSRASCCWGQPKGGIVVGTYRIAVCQPSPKEKGDTGLFLYDFVKMV